MATGDGEGAHLGWLSGVFYSRERQSAADYMRMRKQTNNLRKKEK